MANRVYHCPICGKTYASLVDMYNCAKACEDKEKAQETREHIERTGAEVAISKQYEALKAAIAKYNAKYKDYSYELVLKHEGPTLAAKESKPTFKAKAKAKENESIFSDIEKISLKNLLNTAPPLNYTIKDSNTKTGTDLESFLKRGLNIGDVQKEPETTTPDKVSREVIEKEISELVGEEEMEAIRWLCGPSVAREDVIKSLADLGEELQKEGFDWK